MLEFEFEFDADGDVAREMDTAELIWWKVLEQAQFGAGVFGSMEAVVAGFRSQCFFVKMGISRNAQ